MIPITYRLAVGLFAVVAAILAFGFWIAHGINAEYHPEVDDIATVHRAVLLALLAGLLALEALSAVFGRRFFRRRPSH